MHSSSRNIDPSAYAVRFLHHSCCSSSGFFGADAVVVGIRNRQTPPSYQMCGQGFVGMWWVICISMFTIISLGMQKQEKICFMRGGEAVVWLAAVCEKWLSWLFCVLAA